MADKPQRSCYRVNYYDGGQPATAFVVAGSDNEASNFMGVTDGSAQVIRVAGPVEVAGVDSAHSPLAPNPITVAPFDLPKSVSRAEFEALTAQLSALQAQIAGQGKPVANAGKQ